MKIKGLFITIAVSCVCFFAAVASAEVNRNAGEEEEFDNLMLCTQKAAQEILTTTGQGTELGECTNSIGSYTDRSGVNHITMLCGLNSVATATFKKVAEREFTNESIHVVVNSKIVGGTGVHSLCKW